MFQDFERQLAEERKRNLEKEERKREAERLQERGGWNVLEKDAGSDDSMDVDNPDGTDNGTVILDEEPVAGSGMGAALKLAMSKGYLEKERRRGSPFRNLDRNCKPSATLSRIKLCTYPRHP